MTDQEWVQILLPVSAAILFIGIWLWWANKSFGVWTKPVIQVLPDGGVKIPVNGASEGVGGFLSFSHNNLNPELVLYPDRIEYRALLKRKTTLYSSIGTVDYEVLLMPAIILRYKDSIATLTFRLPNQQIQRQVLEYLHKQHVELTQEAKKFLEDRT